MEFFATLLPESIGQALGWTLLHSLWQGTLLALLLSLALYLTRKHAASLRYWLSLGALASMFVWTALTFVQEYRLARYEHGLAGTELETTYAPDTSVYYLASETLAQTGIDWDALIPWLALGWILGLITFSLRWIGSQLYLQRMRYAYIFPVDFAWQHKLDQLARKMKVSRVVQLLESGSVKVPMVVGHVKPAILLPVGMLAGISPKQLESILAHELAHIRRHDFLINQFQALLELLFFYHPAFWWISARVQDEREHCCDDQAVAVCGDAITYARTLSQLEAIRQQHQVSLAMAMSGRKNHLLNRIKRIVMPYETNSPRRGNLLLTMLLLFGMMGSMFLPELKAQYEINSSSATEPVILLDPVVEKAIPPAPITPIVRVHPEPNPAPHPQPGPEPVPESEAEPLLAFVSEIDGVEVLADSWLGQIALEVAPGVIMVVDSPPPALPPMPPMPPMPAMPALPAMPAMPAMPGMPAVPAPVWTEDMDEEEYAELMEAYAELMEKYGETYAKHYEKYGELMEEYAEAYAEQWEEGMEDQWEQYEEQMETWGEQVEEWAENQDWEEFAEHHHHQEAIRHRHAEQQHLLEEQLHRMEEKQHRLQEEQVRELEAQMRALERARREQQRAEWQVLREREFNKQAHEYASFYVVLLDELENDGLIDSRDRTIKIEMSGDYMRVNGRKVRRSELRKYCELWEEYDADYGEIKIKTR